MPAILIRLADRTRYACESSRDLLEVCGQWPTTLRKSDSKIVFLVLNCVCLLILYFKVVDSNRYHFLECLGDALGACFVSSSFVVWCEILRRC